MRYIVGYLKVYLNCVVLQFPELKMLPYQNVQAVKMTMKMSL